MTRNLNKTYNNTIQYNTNAIIRISIYNISPQSVNDMNFFSFVVSGISVIDNSALKIVVNLKKCFFSLKIRTFSSKKFPFKLKLACFGRQKTLNFFLETVSQPVYYTYQAFLCEMKRKRFQTIGKITHFK